MTYNFMAWDEKRILAASDSVAYEMDGTPLCFISKVIYLPHLKVVLVSSGLATLLHGFARVINMTPLPGGLDDLTKVARRLFHKERQEQIRSLSQRYRIEGLQFDDFSLLIGGWSAALGRMAVYACHYVEGSEEETFEPVLGATRWTTSMPDYDVSIERPRKVIVPDTIIASAKHWKTQVERGRADLNPAGGATIGGELILFEVTRHKAEVRTIHTFDDREAMASRMARLVRPDMVEGEAMELAPAGAA